MGNSYFNDQNSQSITPTFNAILRITVWQLFAFFPYHIHVLTYFYYLNCVLYQLIKFKRIWKTIVILKVHIKNTLLFLGCSLMCSSFLKFTFCFIYPTLLLPLSKAYLFLPIPDTSSVPQYRVGRIIVLFQLFDIICEIKSGLLEPWSNWNYDQKYRNFA